MEFTKEMLVASLKQCADEHKNDSSNVAELCNNTVAFLENKESFNKHCLIEDLRTSADEHQNEFTPTFNICVAPIFRDAARFLENLDLESDSAKDFGEMSNIIPSCHGNHPNGFIQKEINEHDQKLINKARQLHYTDWTEVNEAAAETVDGFWELHHIASKLYHMEEASIGNI